ncbi:N-formylglutamate amidohydrolase [Trinickia symbiotica]|uniref:N-formylglutamate deformylase n=1 Tax=Trinickia symbiotica TaxID=863227 RepID=A0A2N7X505_9BURK|nr:N-formylglutamate amidohydrolase [Trinickia symbiotica]PMS36839.1 hypothetical protein C0Z20_12210 [Trinickia symbiotica]PPK46294.1 N-formylglutamate amidohydrolase [Trinickia symbiotica]
MSDLYTLTRGHAPLLISIPHLGTYIPDALRNQYTEAALTVADTDWHLSRLRKNHANVLLWEAHSIASVLPRLFEGKLPELNIGTQDGRTAAETVLQATVNAAQESNYPWVANGRFKGGFITRHFGAPRHGVHAVQLEMCQITYMEEAPPFAFVPERAQAVGPTLQKMVSRALEAVVAL